MTTDLTPTQIELEVDRRMTNPSFVEALHDYVNWTPYIVRAAQIQRDCGYTADDKRTMLALVMSELMETVEAAMTDQVRRGW